MDADWGRLGARMNELGELDRVLAMLTRPSPVGDGLPSGLLDDLRELGVRMGRSKRRETLIERVWSRKRPLMRQLGALDDWLPPCA